MKAIVDRDTCVGCNLCAEICSDVFSMDDQGKACAIPGEVPKNLEDSCRDAIKQCPVEAIREA
ncbi:MAG: ferredoxin [Lentisphaerae bacterium GWF2_52_8]|nr:MAG: ferredoxin [Lentisphaerae bacterium GWF2_52_8]